MKKRILIIFTGAMEPGGIERSLLGLLDAFDYDRCDVDLFLYAHHGSLFSLINENVNILPEVKELAYLRESFGEKIKHGAYYSAWRRLVDGFFHISPDQSWKKTMLRCVDTLEAEYDLAISFFHPFDLLWERVHAKKKVGWIHTDYSSAEQVSIMELQKSYQGLDKIVAVSTACRDAFTEIFPGYAGKLVTIENILPKSLVLQQAAERDVFDEIHSDGCVTLLTVGRFSYPKRRDEIPSICSYLLQRGLDVKWYLIGYGKDEALIRQKIAEAHMEENVIILGKKENPYPYIKACDVYVQPSRYEGKCVAVREAQMLGKPVIITNYTTAFSQLEDGVDGIVVPMAMKECADGIASVVSDKPLLDKLSENCKMRDYSNVEEIQKIYELMK